MQETVRNGVGFYTTQPLLQDTVPHALVFSAPNHGIEMLRFENEYLEKALPICELYETYS